MCVFCVFAGYAVAQWLGLCLQLLGVGMVAGVSFLAVLEHHFSTVDPGTWLWYLYLQNCYSQFTSGSEAKELTM